MVLTAAAEQENLPKADDNYEHDQGEARRRHSYGRILRIFVAG